MHHYSNHPEKRAHEYHRKKREALGGISKEFGGGAI